MTYMEWDERFSVGIGEIDRQHKSLIDLINKLLETMKQGKGSQVIGAVLDELIAYTRTHFSVEERMFARYSYPRTAEHVAAHAKFVEKVEGFKASLAKNEFGLSVDVLGFLTTWLRDHIMKMDKEYAPFLIAKGVK